VSEIDELVIEILMLLRKHLEEYPQDQRIDVSIQVCKKLTQILRGQRDEQGRGNNI